MKFEVQRFFVSSAYYPLLLLPVVYPRLSRKVASVVNGFELDGGLLGKCSIWVSESQGIGKGGLALDVLMGMYCLLKMDFGISINSVGC